MYSSTDLSTDLFQRLSLRQMKNYVWVYDDTVVITNNYIIRNWAENYVNRINRCIICNSVVVIGVNHKYNLCIILHFECINWLKQSVAIRLNVTDHFHDTLVSVFNKHATRASVDPDWAHIENSFLISQHCTGVDRNKHCQLATCIELPGSLFGDRLGLAQIKGYTYLQIFVANQNGSSKTNFSPRLYEYGTCGLLFHWPWYINLLFSWNKKPFSRNSPHSPVHLEGIPVHNCIQ